MDHGRKVAYLRLLYWAMNDIRQLVWLHRGRRLWNPLWWRALLRQSRQAGDLADWMHNLAMFAVNDFDGFREDYFWQTYDAHIERHAGFGHWNYKELFKGFIEPKQEWPDWLG